VDPAARRRAGACEVHALAITHSAKGLALSTQVCSEEGIQDAYQGTEFAQQYVSRRFESELNRVLHEAQVEAVNRVMREHRPEQALEIAPGPGRVTRDVVPCGSLTCLEYNEGMIETGRQNCRSDINWVQGNAFELPFEQEFGFVYSYRFVRHFHQEDRNRFYEQVRNELHPGGLLVFDAVNQPLSQPLRDRKPEQYPIYDKLYQRDELMKEVTAAGFEILSLTPVQKFPRTQYASQVVLGPRSGLLNKLVIRSLEALPLRDGLEWIVTCRRA